MQDAIIVIKYIIYFSMFFSLQFRLYNIYTERTISLKYLKI